MSNEPNTIDPIDRTDFASADEKFRALVASHADVEAQKRISDYTETFAISETECEVFCINPDEVPGLYWAYERYENLVGMMDAYFEEFREQERIDHARFFRGEGAWSFDDAVGFMVAACNQPGEQSLGWVCKIVAAGVRGGLYRP